MIADSLERRNCDVPLPGKVCDSMSAGPFTKIKYSATLLDRLADNAPCDQYEKQSMQLMTSEEMRESVARDLESLLNCRGVYRVEAFDAFPEALRSICSYGMSDFAGLSLANPADRSYICRSLERTIAIHERRLTQVHVSLEPGSSRVNRLRFLIHALLQVHPSTDTVIFDALLQPSTLQYAVRTTKRVALS